MQLCTSAPLDQLLRFTALFILGYGGAISVVEAQASNASNACLQQQCGDMKVSYPFTLASAASECPSFAPSFELECDDKSGNLLFNKATINRTKNFPLKVLEISPGSLVVDVSDIIVRLRINPSNGTCEKQAQSLILPGFPSPYALSDQNWLASFGCAYSIVVTADPAEDNANFSSDSVNTYKNVTAGGCDVGCPIAKTSADCGNQTCCLFHWPDGAFPRWTVFASSTSYLYTVQYDQSTCLSSYSAIYHPDYSNFQGRKFGLKLQWALPSNLTTSRAIMQSPDYACSNQSQILMVTQIPGYLCSCSDGYSGDGYTQGTKCTDINECQDDALNECIEGRTKCHNLEGTYACKCTSLFRRGDGRRNGSGCRFSYTIKCVLIAIASLLLFIMLLGSYYAMYIWWQRRLKRQYFKGHGGMQLQNLVGSRGKESTRLFNEQELKDATNNFSAGMKLGMGGFGTVFKGVMPDGKIVAIKRANKNVNAEQLFNEMKIMVQLNHRNIVRFLGCCLETQEPLIVYEYVSNGDVFQNLREDNPDCMNWEQRVKVATQSAEALAYLHAVAIPPILHRDVKSSNVLLDNNFDAKVADFGVSRLVPEGASHVSTAVQGTLGYLDPEYFQTLQLTERSDVYSLGVMLVELITALKPVDTYSREPRFANLAILFIHHMQELAKLDDIIDNRLSANDRPSIEDMSSVAIRCLSLEGRQRPLMREVAHELRRIMYTYHGVEKMANPTLSQSPNRHRFGAVIATGSDFGVHTSSSPPNSTSTATDNASSDCPLPR